VIDKQDNIEVGAPDSHPPSSLMTSEPVVYQPVQKPQESSLKDSLRASAVNEGDQLSIGYLTMVDHSDMDQKYRFNMLSLLSMGFSDFLKNLKLLEQNKNNLELVC